MATIKKPAKAGKSTAMKKTAGAKAIPTKTSTTKKTAAEKSEAKKVAAKTAAPAKKPTTKKPAAKAASVKKPVAPAPESSIKVLNLFDAFAQNRLPRDEGYIVSSFFKENSAYSIYEIVSYSGVKEIMNLGEGLQFTSTSKKLHVLLEPPSYNFKHVQPVSRQAGDSIPYRENELEIIQASNLSRIMVAKAPLEVPSSFTIIRPSGINFAVIFYNLPDIYQSIKMFFVYSLNKARHIPQRDAEKAAALISNMVEKVMGFHSDFS